MGAASLFGTLGYLSRQVGALGLDSVSFVVWRALIGAVVVGAFLASGLTGRMQPAAGTLPARFARLTSQRKVALLVGGVLGALLNIALFAAFARMAIAVALICFYTFPALVTVAAVPLYGDRLEPRRLAALGLSLLGLGLVLLGPLAEAGGGLSVDPLGVGLALFAALCQTAWFLIAGRGFRPLIALDVSAWLLVVAIIIAAVLAALLGNGASLLLPAADPRLWPWLLAAGIAGAAIPTTAFMAGIARIGPARAAILMTFEPVVGVTLAAG